MIRHFLTRQFLGFVAVGIIAAVIHWLSRILLSHWVTFSTAIIIAYGIGMLVAFTLNCLYVFPHSARPRRQQARDFVLINLAFLPLVWVASILLAQVLRSLGVDTYAETLAHGIAIALPALATFLLYKFFAFKDTEQGRK